MVIPIFSELGMAFLRFKSYSRNHHKALILNGIGAFPFLKWGRV